MKALVITPKSQREFIFISDLLKKLGVAASDISEDDLEDIGLSKMLKEVDKKKKVSRETIMGKLKK